MGRNNKVVLTQEDKEYIISFSNRDNWKKSTKIAEELNLPCVGTIDAFRAKNGLHSPMFRLTDNNKKSIREWSTPDNYKSEREICDLLNISCTLATINGFRRRNKLRTKDLNIKRKCLVCGNEFILKTYSGKYCSPKCCQESVEERRRKRKGLEGTKKPLPNLSDDIIKSIHKFSEKSSWMESGELGEKLGLPTSEIYRIRKKFGWLTINSKQWTEEDEKFIKENYLQLSDSELAKHFNVDIGVIRRKRVGELRLLRPKWYANCRLKPRPCVGCGTMFMTYNTKQKFCSEKCYIEYIRKEHPNIKKLYTVCKTEFEVEYGKRRQKFCSKKCSMKSERFKAKLKIRTTLCEGCGKPVNQKSYSYVQKYCSHECYVKCKIKNIWTEGDLRILIEEYYNRYSNGESFKGFRDVPETPLELLASKLKKSVRNVTLKANNLGLTELFISKNHKAIHLLQSLP